jgi:ABC-type taurine transport system substrate-binding protein
MTPAQKSLRACADLFNAPPANWREQSELARKIAKARKAEKSQLVSLLYASLARMTEKPKYRRPL